MHAVILAAGRGTRLGSAVPKTLSRLATGETILGRQLTELARHLPIGDVMVVVGYGAQVVMENFSDATYVYNPSFLQENTARSLLRALRRLDDDVVMLNGDLVFRSGSLDALVKCPTSAMLVNRATVGEEEMKYRLDESGHVAAVSKQLADGAGEAVGANLITHTDLPMLVHALEQCAIGDYFERGFELAIADGLRFVPVLLGADDCVEIDFPEDLARSGELLRRWGDAPLTRR
jgi:L-glutamine-phosphate cytidylyltransferase